MTRTEQTVQPMSRDDYASIVQRAGRVFSLMRPMVESPDSRLKGYRNDFYVHDRDYLRATHATGQYLWIVRETGTELRRLGVHSLDTEWLQATMQITSNRDMYLVDADRMTISTVPDDARAEQLMSRYSYSVEDGVISKEGVPLVQISTEIEWKSGAEQKIAHVTLTSLRPFRSTEHTVLARLAELHARKEAQSMFTPVAGITLDGRDLYAMLAPAVAGLDSRSTWHGVIQALPDEADFLRSLKIELAPFSEQSKGFAARLSGEAMENLKPYEGSVQWDLHRLPWTVKPEGAIESVQPLSRLTAANLRGYDAFVSWELANGNAESDLAAAIGALATEKARRAAPRARHVPAPAGDAGLSFA